MRTKTLHYINFNELKNNEKGPYKGLVANVQTDGEGKPFLASFLQFTFSDDFAIQTIGKEIVMIDEERVPDEFDETVYVDGPTRKITDFNYKVLQALLAQCEVVVSHNAKFVHNALSKSFGSIPFKTVPFACSMNEINFPKDRFSSLALEYLVYKYGSYYETRNDEASALAFLLVQEGNFSELMENLYGSSGRIRLVNLKFSDKEEVKKLGYTWDPADKTWVKSNVSDFEKEESVITSLGIECHIERETISPEEKNKEGN